MVKRNLFFYCLLVCMETGAFESSIVYVSGTLVLEVRRDLVLFRLFQGVWLAGAFAALFNMRANITQTQHSCCKNICGRLAQVCICDCPSEVYSLKSNATYLRVQIQSSIFPTCANVDHLSFNSNTHASSKVLFSPLAGMS